MAERRFGRMEEEGRQSTAEGGEPVEEEEARRGAENVKERKTPARAGGPEDAFAGGEEGENPVARFGGHVRREGVGGGGGSIAPGRRGAEQALQDVGGDHGWSPAEEADLYASLAAAFRGWMAGEKSSGQ